MLCAHVGVECPQVSEGLNELKVVRGWGLADQGKRLNPGIVQAVVNKCIEQRCDLRDELGVAIHVRDYKYLIVLLVLTGSIRSTRQQIAKPLIERRLQDWR
jgi:hypothetical protein